MTGAYLYISLLSSGGCFGAWIDHLDSFKNPNPRHSKVGFLKVVCYKHCVCLYDERACEIWVAKYRTGCEASFQLLKGAFCFFVPFLRESSTVCWFPCFALLLPLSSRRGGESIQWRSDLVKNSIENYRFSIDFYRFL